MIPKITSENFLLSIKLYNFIENGKIREALSLISKDNNQAEMLAWFLCKYYKQSKKPEVWDRFWQETLKYCKENGAEMSFFISAVMTQSIQNRDYNLISIIIDFIEDHNISILIDVKIISALVIDANIADLNAILNIIDSKLIHIKQKFCNKLIISCFNKNKITLLKGLNDIKNFFNISDYLINFSYNELKCLAYQIVCNEIDINFINNILNNIQNEGVKSFLYNEIVSGCVILFKVEFFNNIAKYTDKNLFLKTIATLDKSRQNSVFYLLSFNNPINVKLIKEILDSFEDKAKDFYNDLVSECVNRYNVCLLQELQSLEDPYDFNFAIQNLNQEKLHSFLKLDKNLAYYLQVKMEPFTQEFGKIKYEDALLTLAQRYNRKAYKFEPVVLNNQNELDDFFEYLSIFNQTITQSFIYITGYGKKDRHFVSGEICITENKTAKIFLIDSLGNNKENIYHEELIITFSKIFSSHEIFLAKEQRQNSCSGCSVFALDDIAHLATLRIANYANIWEYLDSEKIPGNLCTINENDNSIDLYIVPLPLSLTRTMQSTKLFTEVIAQKTQEIQKFPINKKQQTTQNSALKFFKNLSKEQPKYINTRLEYKFAKMAEQNWNFLITHSKQKIEESMQCFTLDKFIEKINLQIENNIDETSASNKKLKT